MLIFLNVINPTNLTDLSDLTSEFRETSNGSIYICLDNKEIKLRKTSIAGVSVIAFAVSKTFTGDGNTD